MNYKKIIDALVVINKQAKKGEIPELNFSKISNKIKHKGRPPFYFDENQVTPDELNSLYEIKDLVIQKLIEHGQLKGDTYHQFSRGGFAVSLKSKFAKKDEKGKAIGEFHNKFEMIPKAFKRLKYDGVLASHQDKNGGHYKASYDLAQALYIVSDFLDDDHFNISKIKKNLAIAKRKKII
jgi:hypothetical protein